jgi:hypothetical protein
MKESINDWIDDKAEGPSVGQHRFVTDANHNFFCQGDLLASCGWSNVMHEWAPVLFCWISCLDANHHRPFFRRIFEGIVKHLSEKFDKKSLTHVSLHHCILRGC